MAIYDVSDLCVYCGKDTSFGSGRFINRVVASIRAEDSALAEDAAAVGAEMVEGFSCAQCLELDCDKCGNPIALDEDYKVDGTVLHYECLTRDQFVQHLLEEGYTPEDSEYKVLLEDFAYDHKEKEVTA